MSMWVNDFNDFRVSPQAEALEIFRNCLQQCITSRGRHIEDAIFKAKQTIDGSLGSLRFCNTCFDFRYFCDVFQCFKCGRFFCPTLYI